MNIDGIEVGGANPCRFVVEMSNSFNGSLATAHKIIDAAATTGAEFFKVQAYLPSELVSLRGDGPAPEPWGAQGWSMRDLYTKAQTPLAWLPELFAHARDVGLVPFSSVFGLESLAACEAADCVAYKVAALDNGSAALHRAIRKTRKPVIVSVRRDQEAVQTRAMALYGDDVAFLLCPEGYPQPPASSAFRESDFFGTDWYG